MVRRKIVGQITSAAAAAYSLRGNEIDGVGGFVSCTQPAALQTDSKQSQCSSAFPQAVAATATAVLTFRFRQKTTEESTRAGSKMQHRRMPCVEPPSHLFREVWRDVRSYQAQILALHQIAVHRDRSVWLCASGVNLVVLPGTREKKGQTGSII